MESPPVTPKSRREPGVPQNDAGQHVIHLRQDVKSITLNMQMPPPTLSDVLNNYLPSADRMPSQRTTTTIAIPDNTTSVKLVFDTAERPRAEENGATKLRCVARCRHRDEHFINVPTKSLLHPGKEYVRADTVGKNRWTLQTGDLVLVLSCNSSRIPRWREGRVGSMGPHGAVPIEYWRQGDDGQWDWKPYAGRHGGLIACPHDTLYVFPPDHPPPAGSSKLIP